MKTGILVILLSIASIINAQEADTIKYKVLPPEEFIKEYNGNADAVILDVRETKDYRKSRIKDAINLPYSTISEEYFGGPDAVASDKSLFIYCYAGVRSKKSAVLFYDHGYRNLFSMEGGFYRWKAKNMDVERKKSKKQ